MIWAVMSVYRAQSTARPVPAAEEGRARDRSRAAERAAVKSRFMEKTSFFAGLASIIVSGDLQYKKICGIYTFSTNAKSGKITCFRFSERGGHRLKAALKRVVWFARERPLRGGRLFRRYQEIQVRV